MDRIQTTLELVRKKLNAFFVNADPARKEWVVLSNLVDHEGRPSEHAKDFLVMYLANIQHETVISTYKRAVPVNGDRYAAVAPPLYINLYVLFFANFYDLRYRVGLGMISRTISFFQQNPWFTHENLPGLDPSIDKLTFEFTNVDITDLNYLMGLAGVKYLPSVYFKVRMIPFQTGAMRAQIPAAQGVGAEGELKEPDRQPAPTFVDDSQRASQNEERRP